MSVTIEHILAASPASTRGQPTQLSTDAKGQRIAYASGKSIFVRSIDQPSVCKQYTGHTAQTTVARLSPSGFYVASGDVSGMVRVWDAVEAVNTKGEYHIINGRINDIAWDGDSARIIAVGDGRERFGACITADSGNSVGEVIGHSKVVNAVAIKPQRPYRAATVSDDGAMCFLHGPPFKFNAKQDGLHKGYIYGTAFSPDGSTLVTVGADHRIQLYDGKTGEPTRQIGEGSGGGHTGSIFAVSWSQDGKKLATAGGDQTVRLWDVASGKEIQVWRFGEEGVISVPDQQVGVVIPHGRTDGLIISMNLNGELIYLHEGKDKPTRTVQGHDKSITALGPASDGKGSQLFTGSFDGRVCAWDVGRGEARLVDGQQHTNQVTQFVATGGQTFSVGWDDTLRVVDEAAATFTGAATKLPAQPKGVALADGRIVVATAAGVAIYSGGKLVAEKQLDFAPTCVAGHGSLVALGADNNSVRVYKLDSSGNLSLVETLTKSTAQISVLAFSKDGRYLAAGNALGKIVVYNVKGSWEVVTDRWSAHTARVTCLTWNDAGTHAASGGLDTNLHVWSLSKPGSRVKAGNAHKDGVNGVAWVDGERIASAGGDAAVKIWTVKGLQ